MGNITFYWEGEAITDWVYKLKSIMGGGGEAYNKNVVVAVVIVVVVVVV